MYSFSKKVNFGAMSIPDYVKISLFNKENARWIKTTCMDLYDWYVCHAIRLQTGGAPALKPLPLESENRLAE